MADGGIVFADGVVIERHPTIGYVGESGRIVKKGLIAGGRVA